MRGRELENNNRGSTDSPLYNDTISTYWIKWNWAQTFKMNENQKGDKIGFENELVIF